MTCAAGALRYESPYVASCRFCEQGLLRLTRCDSCKSIVAMCDECELIWNDVAAVREHTGLEASSSFPHCATCNEDVRWTRLSLEEVKEAGLKRFVIGESE